MELTYLRYFLAVAEELHFALGAERLHVERSPVSRASPLTSSPPLYRRRSSTLTSQ